MSEPSATIERDLAAIDAALRSGVAAGRDSETRELQELALELRAEATAPEPEFAQRLGARLEAGFPAEPGSPRARLEAASSSLSRAPRRTAVTVRRALPAVGVIGAIVLPVVVAITLAGPPDGSDGGGDDAASGGGAAAEQAAPPTPPGAGFAPGQPNRRIERSVSLELDVPRDEVARVAEEVTAVTNRHGGFVLSSSVDTGEDASGGDFSLRIPSDRLRPALRDLAGLAPVVSQTQEGRDVTRQHVTTKDRLQAARAERRSLLNRLEEADTDAEAEAIRRRLDLVAGEISGLRGQLRDLRLRTDYAVVLVSLLVEDVSGGGGAGGSFDDAIDDAGDLLVGTAGVLIRALALALPLAAIAGALWAGSAWVRRRRRESALV
jgi:hypothetical protein